MREERDGRRALRVVLVEDQDLFRDLLKVSLNQSAYVEVVGEFRDGESALEGALASCPDVAVLDISLPGAVNGIQLGRRLRRQRPDLGIVLLSSHADPAFLASVPDQEIAGWSYLLKQSTRDLETLVRAIAGSAAGEVVLDPELLAGREPTMGALTPRQREILHLMALGYSNAAIAEENGVALKTVENQINVLYSALAIDRSDPAVQPRVKAVLQYLRARHLR